jgi:hypothetical protein
MKRIVKIMVIATIIVSLQFSAYGAIPGKTYEYGEDIDQYRNVWAKSNGNCVAKYGTDGCPALPTWQCVEYVKRFYNDAMLLDTSSWSGNGNRYYENAVSGALSPYLTPYANGGSMPPQPDDLLGFSGGTGGYGHVAIITEVGNDYVNIIEQNWARNSAIHQIPYDRNVNRIGDANGNRGDYYHIQGWLRKDAWSFNTPNNFEGWKANNVGDQSVNSGRYFINPQRTDPYIYSAALSLDANNYDAIEINMASNAPNGVGQIYFTTSASPGYSEDKRVEFYVTNSGSWKTYTIYMKNHPKWTGTITGIRIDPAALGFKDYNYNITTIF